MYYLLHYFNPDFSHMHLSPVEKSNGNIGSRYLGYVQNVVQGQVLAEIVKIDDMPGTGRDPRFVRREVTLPIGPNCAAHPDNPDKIIATANGYVFYHNGLISVKRMLNVRCDVGFHTGNIFFVGDLAVHGNVQTGFALKAGNILIKGHVESAKIKGIGDVVCLSGVKGDNTSAIADEPEKTDDSDRVPSALIEARGNIRMPFCEHVQLRARGNIIIDGSCLHSTLYVGGNLVVKGRLQGGTVYANGLVHVEGQLGSDYTVPTRIKMGYDPFEFLSLQKLESQITWLKEKLAFFEKMAGRNKVMEQEYTPRVELMSEKLKIATSRHNALRRKFSATANLSERCRIVVPGKVMPGCVISIATACYRTSGTSGNITFSLLEDEVIMRQGKTKPGNFYA